MPCSDRDITMLWNSRLVISIQKSKEASNDVHWSNVEVTPMSNLRHREVERSEPLQKIHGIATASEIVRDDLYQHT